MSERRNIAWTQPKLDQLKAAFKETTPADTFTLTLDPEGEITLVRAYARHLIEYLEGEFAKRAPPARPSNEGESSYTTGSGSWEGGEEL